MPRFFKNKYRVDTWRLQSWDYGWNAAYYITICTSGRLYHFGDVVGKEMQLSEIGMIADDCWVQIPEHFPFVKLGNHIVMPNHVHGIVVIDKPADDMAGLWGDGGRFDMRDMNGDNNDGGDDDVHDGGDTNAPVEAQDLAPLPPITPIPQPTTSPSSPLPPFPPSSKWPPSPHPFDDTPKNTFGPQSRNLASIIRGYKTGVTIRARKINPAFKWQPRYYDHIIRNEKSFNRISEYISTNPQNWHKDKFKSQ